MIYPTEPVTHDHELGEFRVWLNGPQWYVANIAGVGEWSGPTEASVVASAIDALRRESDEPEPVRCERCQKITSVVSHKYNMDLCAKCCKELVRDVTRRAAHQRKHGFPE